MLEELHYCMRLIFYVPEEMHHYICSILHVSDITLCPKKCIIALCSIFHVPKEMHHCMFLIFHVPEEIHHHMCPRFTYARRIASLHVLDIACARRNASLHVLDIACARKNPLLNVLDTACARRNASLHVLDTACA